LKILLDSNLLFYLSGIRKTIYSELKIWNALPEHENLYISELTLMELLTLCKGDQRSYIRATNFLVEKKIRIHQILENESTIVKKANAEEIINLDFFVSLCDEATGLRMKIECEFLTFWFVSITSLFLMFLFRLYPNLSDESKKNVLAQNNSIIATISKNPGLFQDKLIEMLTIYYFSDKKQLKMVLNGFLLDIVRIYNSVFDAAREGQVFLKLYRDAPEDSEESEFEKMFTTSPMSRQLKNKSASGKEKIVHSAHLKLFDAVQKSYAEKIEILDKRILGYNLIVFRKYFTTQSYLIRKNDIFDSIFLKYCESFTLLTLDVEFQKRIREIDAESYAQISIFKENLND